MCGIFGVVSTGSLQGFPLQRATDTLRHRGPDSSGTFRDEHSALGHRRLSIIDLSTGDQPLFNEDRSLCIIFNGEVYNFVELREELQRRGHAFSTRSDTETILHAYEEWGEQAVERLRGMFAFAIWDRREKRLFLARDRFGIKPLFYAESGGKLLFASEMKAILVDPDVSRTMDDTALACYFTLSYIPAPFTIYRGIRKLLPGHVLTWQNGSVAIRKYWDLAVVPDRGRSEKYFIDGFIDRFGESVAAHLVSDVPLGAFLSGGVDSGAVVAMMRRAEPGAGKVNTFSIGFGGNTGGYLDERRYARMVAEKYATEHREYEVVPDAHGIVGKIVDAFDEPFADDSAIPSYYLCKVARESVTVALSGLGGDELFAGYERHLGVYLRGAYFRLPAFIRRNLIQRAVERLPELPSGRYTINHMKRFVRASAQSPADAYYGYLSRLHGSVVGSLFEDVRRFREPLQSCRDLVMGYYNTANVSDPGDSLSRALYCDIKLYLPDDILAVTDRMSMRHSLEVRVPFVDHQVVEFCASIPQEMKIKWLRKKYLLKRAVAGLLPREVITHRKQGFVGPMARWLQTDLREYMAATLERCDDGPDRVLNGATIRRIVQQHLEGREIHDSLIWSALVFCAWRNGRDGGAGDGPGA